MIEYTVKNQFRLGNTWFSDLSLSIGVLGIIIWALGFFINIQQETLIIALVCMDIGFLLWVVIFIRRIRYLYGFYSPVLFFIFIIVFPFGIAFLPPFNIGPLTISDTGYYITSFLGFMDFSIVSFIYMHEMKKFYFTIDIIQGLVDYFSNMDPETKVSSIDLSTNLGLSQLLTELYIHFLIDYDPEIGETDSLEESFTISAKTVSILHDLIQELETSPQEKFLKSLRTNNL